MPSLRARTQRQSDDRTRPDFRVARLDAATARCRTVAKASAATAYLRRGPRDLELRAIRVTWVLERMYAFAARRRVASCGQWPVVVASADLAERKKHSLEQQQSPTTESRCGPTGLPSDAAAMPKPAKPTELPQPEPPDTDTPRATPRPDHPTAAGAGPAKAGCGVGHNNA